MTLQFQNRTQIRVRYGETDQMGYCYYGNYAQYFEVGRVEALRSLGMSYRNLEESGVMLPVSRYEIDFRAPAFYDDLLDIVTNITLLEGAKITFQYQAFRGEQLLARASTVLVFVDKTTMRPIRPPKEFLSLIKPLEESPKLD
jgi:acyl-CoA thioester hydrolase